MSKNRSEAGNCNQQLMLSRLGEERLNNQGILMRIIDYYSWNKIKVLFLNGHDEVVETRYDCFKNGEVKSYKSIIGTRLYGHKKEIAGEVIDTIGHNKIVVRYDSGEILTLNRVCSNKCQFLPPPYKRYDLTQLTEIPIWKDHYIDKEGNVYNSKARMLKPKISKTGYLQFGTRLDGKRAWFTVHRLMALTFLPKIEGKNEVNHIDGNKANNRLDNLEWCTTSENCLHRSRVLGKCIGEKQGLAVLTEDMVREIVKMRENGYTYKAIAEHFNIYPSRIVAIMMGDTWNHVTGFPLRRKYTNNKYNNKLCYRLSGKEQH